MNSSHIYSASRVFIGVLIVVTVVAYLNALGAIHTSEQGMVAEAVQSPIAGLEVTLSQSPSDSLPSVLVTVTNTNAEPVTILQYESPLESAALQLGLLSITPTAADASLEIPKILVRRVWPPRPESLITIARGESSYKEIMLFPIFVPSKIGDGATVVLKGEWQAVWAKHKEDISESSLEDPRGSPDAFQGVFESNELGIAIR